MCGMSRIWWMWCIKHTGRLQLFHLLTLTKAHFDNVDDEFVIGFFAFHLLLLLLLSDECSMWWTRLVSTHCMLLAHMENDVRKTLPVFMHLHRSNSDFHHHITYTHCMSQLLRQILDVPQILKHTPVQNWISF